MDPNEWKHEMKRMLDSFENQAEHSLGKINRCFETLGQPFDDDFRKYYLEMSNQRLDMTFKAVLFSKGRVRGNETVNSMNLPSSTKKQSLNSAKNEHDDDLIEIYDSEDDNYSDIGTPTDSIHDGTGIQIEAEFNRGNDSGAMIEVYDSDDEERSYANQTNASANEVHTKINQNSPSNNRNDSEAGAPAGKDVKTFVKNEPNDGNAMEMADIPLVAFDPNGQNGDAAAVSKNSGSSKTHQTNRSKRSNHLKRDSDTCNSNGLYQCTLCVRQFTHVNDLSKHMNSHKNNQRLHYCAHCLYEFDRETEKNGHENRCEGHHFECHLCKMYVVRAKSKMQRHMRIHSGAKPFQCMVCNKYFTEKYSLNRHLNSIHFHSRNIA